MIASGLSGLGHRSIVEGALRPLHCTCTITDGYMTVRINDLASKRVFHEAGISMAGIKTSRDISSLVEKLRAGWATATAPQAQHSAA